MLRFCFLLLLVLSLVCCKIDPTQTSVSGLSSGAFFATQYQVAFSSTIKGAAIFAGGPYYCAQDQLLDALLMCMEGIQSIPLSTLETDAQNFANSGAIDSLSNLAKHRVYIYSGVQDITVKPSVVKSLEQMYRDWNVSSVVTEYTIQSAHTFPTLDFGNLCLLSYTPYISKCSYDGAGIALNQIYGSLQPAGQAQASNYLQLSQQKFTPGGVSPSSLSLADTGYLYVPTACQNKSNVCKLHVAFHGCEQNQATVGMAFVQSAGYNGWAESNNIIVAYPQTIVSLLSPSNPEGCWDWWGYLNGNYATKTGPQMQTIKNLIDYVISSY